MNMLTCVATVFVDAGFEAEANELIRTKEEQGWYLREVPTIIKDTVAMFTFEKPEKEENINASEYLDD